jgi:hypothetical protein
MVKFSVKALNVMIFLLFFNNFCFFQFCIKTHLQPIAINLNKLNSDSVNQLWIKALERSKKDPEGTLTVASSLLDSTIKGLLDELGISYNEKKDDLPTLYKILSKELSLSPDNHTEDIFKQILGGCYSIVIGLGSIRNKISDAHGKGKKSVKPALRHSELAINLAGSMASFLIST